MSDAIPNDQTTATSPGEDFVQLFSAHQRRLYLYILAQVPRPADAEEILQETNIVLWRKFGQFEPGTSFFAWGCRIAAYEVLKYRERRRRDRLCFSDGFVEQVAHEAQTAVEDFDDRRRALQHCLGRLREEDRELIQQRYAPGANGKSVAKSLGRPVNSVYQSLSRIRKALLECINRRLTAEARS